MRLSRLALGAAVSVLLAMLQPQPALAGSLAASAARDAAAAATLEHRVLHGHARKSTSFYCYPRNYWWFYRPYTTAAEGYARCMPYFHYPPEAYRGRRDPYGVK